MHPFDEIQPATNEADELANEIQGLIQKGEYRGAVASFARSVPTVPIATDRDDAWKAAAHYDAALALSRVGRTDEARRHIELSGLGAGGDTDMLPYEERAAIATQLRERQQKAAGNPAIFITALPKSASAFVSNTLADLHGIPVLRASFFPGMTRPWVARQWVTQIAEGGATTHEHYSALNANLTALAEGGAKRIFVQVRDPRAALWSYFHHEMGRAYLRESPVDTTALARVWYQQAIQWLESWIDARNSVFGLDVQFVHYDDVRLKPVPTLARICALSGSTVTEAAIQKLLNEREAAGRKPDNFRSGKPTEWRDNLPPDIQDELWELTPPGIRSFLKMDHFKSTAPRGKNVVLPPLMQEAYELYKKTTPSSVESFARSFFDNKGLVEGVYDEVIVSIDVKARTVTFDDSPDVKWTIRL